MTARLIRLYSLALLAVLFGTKAGNVLYAQTTAKVLAFNVKTGVLPAQRALWQALLNLNVAELRGSFPALFASLISVQPLHPKAQQLSPENPVAQWFTLTFQTADSLVLATALEQSGRFSVVEANRLHPLHVVHQSPNDPATASQWYHAYIQTFTAWQNTTGDSAVVVGVLDTGLDFDHPEFTGQLAFNKLEDKPPFGVFTQADIDGVDDDGNGYIDDVVGYDFADQPRLLGGGDYLDPDPVPFDDNQHGTLVAGILAARANNGVGGVGIAPGCKVMVLRAFSGQGVGEDDDVARAIVYAADNGARVLNYSFGDIYPSQMMHAAIQYADQRGVIQVASAGNGTGDNLHYPSGFQEVIAVSASDYNPATGREFLWPLSSFGNTVALCAPGSGIYCPIPRDTAGNARYGNFSGTSCAAPMVSAAAALLLSARDSLTPSGFRALVCASADDLGAAGWDYFTGAGRLNISNLLALYGNGQVEILSPQNDDGSAEPQIAVIGTVLHPLFESWQLSYQAGDQAAANWITLTQLNTNQVLADTLALWPLNNLNDTVYTLRLSVKLRNGQTQEHRVRFLRDTSPPSIQLLLAASAWEDNLRKPFFVIRASDVCTHELHLQAPGDTSFRIYTADKHTRQAEFIIEPNELPAKLLSGGVIVYRFRSTNASGLSITTGVLQDVVYFPDAVDTSGVRLLPYRLPYGDALPEAFDFDTDGNREVLISQFDTSFSYGRIKFYEWQGGQFVLADSIASPNILLPKDVADADGDGKPELLCNFTDSVYVFEPSNSPYPTRLDWSDFNTKVFPSQWADYNSSGRIGLIAKDFTHFYAFEVNNGGFVRRHTLRDDSANYAGSGTRTLCADFDNDGLPEVVTGDFDGRIFTYEYLDDATGFIPVYQLDTKQVETANYLQQGDFDGDGTPEILVASRTNLLRNADYEYDAKYWTLRILKAVSNNTYETVWEDYIYNVNSQFFNASLSADLDADNRDELLIHTYPRTYLLEHHGGGYRFTWFAYGTNAVGGVAGDFNNNGVQEFAIGVGDSLLFFERQTNYNGPVPLRLLQGKPLSNSSSRLWWFRSGNATAYEVWRGLVVGGSANLTRQATVTDTFYVDQFLTAGNQYVYRVRPINPGTNPTTGAFSNFVLVTTGPAPRLVQVEAKSTQQLVAQFSTPVTDRPGDAGLFRITANNGALISGIESVIPQAPNGLLLNLTSPLAPGSYKLWVDTAFTDRIGLAISPIAEERSKDFVLLPDTTKQLHLLRFSVLDERTASLTFSHSLANNALIISNYTVKPYGSVSQVQFADSATLTVTLNQAVLGPTGIPITLLIKGLTGSAGQVQRPEGDAATFWQPATDLTGVYVYPNPVVIGQTDFGCRFAGVPKGATITILTAAGHLVRTLTESNNDGGVAWDLTTYEGKAATPGVYLFRIETLDGQSTRGSFALVK